MVEIWVLDLATTSFKLTPGMASASCLLAAWDGLIAAQVYCAYRWMDGWMDGRTDGGREGRREERMDGCMDGWMDG